MLLYILSNKRARMERQAISMQPIDNTSYNLAFDEQVGEKSATIVVICDEAVLCDGHIKFQVAVLFDIP